MTMDQLESSGSYFSLIMNLQTNNKLASSLVKLQLPRTLTERTFSISTLVGGHIQFNPPPPPTVRGSFSTHYLIVTYVLTPTPNIAPITNCRAIK